VAAGRVSAVPLSRLQTDLVAFASECTKLSSGERIGRWAMTALSPAQVLFAGDPEVPPAFPPEVPPQHPAEVPAEPAPESEPPPPMEVPPGTPPETSPVTPPET
jgi:hypothetical protein